jgi:pyruvate,water dikinase
MAVVLTKPTEASIPARPFVLVCPCADPAWVPWFARAQALVAEAGGVLSHAAIVAREFGLPAVAGLPNIHRQLKTGEQLRVDGNAGTVSVMGNDRSVER